MQGKWSQMIAWGCRDGDGVGHVGVEWVMYGWGGSCRGGWVVSCRGGWVVSCRGVVGHVGVG